MPTPSKSKRTSDFQPPAYLQDRCWLIPVVAASVMFLTAIISSSKGYLFVLYMDYYVVDHATASWVESTFLVTSALVGFGQALIQTKVSVFWLTMLSVATVCAGIVGGAYCPNMVCMSVAIGGVYGAGYGATLTSFGLYTMLYFEKYKATATGLNFAALAVAGLVTPAFMPLLVYRYGLQGALLLSGAITMQAFPLVMLIKKPQPFRFWCHLEGTVPESSSTRNPNELQPMSSTEELQSQHLPVPDAVSPARQNRPAAGIVGISWKSVAELLVIPEFYVLIIVYLVNGWVTTSQGTTVVDYGRDKGASLESSNYLQTYGAVGEILGRTVVPFLSDKVPFGHSLFVAAGLGLSSLALFGMTFVESFACFATLHAVFGVCQGYVMSARPILITDYLGLHRIPVFAGFVGLSLLPISLGNPTIVGFFRDTLGSYDNFYRVFGAVNIVASVLLFCITYRAWASARGCNRGTCPPQGTPAQSPNPPSLSASTHHTTGLPP
ncbi:monocarboxylate transporter 12-like isoform X1 [Haemaphysalis longicornis]